MVTEKRKNRTRSGNTPVGQTKALQQTKLWGGKEHRSSPSSSPLPQIQETQKQGKSSDSQKEFSPAPNSPGIKTQKVNTSSKGTDASADQKLIARVLKSS